MAKDQSYDSACEILAEYFLGQPRDPEHVKALAQHVQQAVEDWFVDKNGWYVPASEEPTQVSDERQLTAEEQSMIDRAWEKHAAAKPKDGATPNPNRTTRDDNAAYRRDMKDAGRGHLLR